MIQRIQTVWLLLAGLAVMLTIQFPFYSGINDPAIPYQELTGKNGGILILLVTLLIAVIAFVAIGVFKNRSTQLLLCIAGILLEALLLFLYYNKINRYTQGTLALASIVHLFIILFFALAVKGISKDNKLIKDSDRLR